MSEEITPGIITSEVSIAEDDGLFVTHVGQEVVYTLSEYDAETINQRRTGALDEQGARRHLPGIQTFEGNQAEEGQKFPAKVVRVWGDQPTSPANLVVTLDGTDTYWATSRKQGSGVGEFSAVWPA